MEHSLGTNPTSPVDDACHEPFRTAWPEIESTLETTIVDRLRDGLARHRECVTEIGLADAAPEHWLERSERLLEYRRVINTELLSPMMLAFESGGPSTTIGTAISTALDRSVAACRDLPASADFAWTEGALAPSSSDGTGRRIGKFFARGLSAARRVGQTRPVPLRAAAQRHLATVVAPGMDATAAESMTEWVEWSRRVELTWVRWGDTALTALVRAEQPDSEDTDEQWGVIRTAANQLHETLAALADEAPLESPHVNQRLGEAHGILDAELAITGSFLLRPSEETRALSLRRSTRLTGALEAWEQGVAARLQLYIALLSILAGATAVQRRLVWRFREECLSDVARLAEIADDLGRLGKGLSDGSPGKELSSRLNELDASVRRALEPAIEAVPSARLVDKTVTEGADATVEALQAMVRQAPAGLTLHAESEKTLVGSRRVETRTLAFQELARQSFDALRIERIRRSTLGLITAVEEVRSDVSELPGVYSFAYEAAQHELEAGLDGANERAVGLVSEALTSIAESLVSETRDLDAALDTAQSRLAEEISEGSLGLLDRLAAGRMTASLFAAWSRAAELRAWINEKWGPPVDRAARIIALRVAVARRLITRGIKAGGAIVGTSGTGAASQRSLKAVASAKDLTERLPLVYQRLFTFDSVSDRALLAGRESTLAETFSRWTRWQSEDGIPLVVQGRQGSGITSFLNVLCGEIEAGGGSLARVSLDARVSSEEALAAILTDTLGLPVCPSLDAVAAAIFAAPDGKLPDAATIDNLEHVYLRIPGGTDLIERLLTLMAETEPRVFWIGGITASAWQLVCAAEPTAVSQVEVLDLPPLTPAEIRNAVTIRHRRSGLPVRFEEPASGRPLLRHRLRRIRDKGGYQELLEDHFFNGLSRTSSGHVSLALYQWLVAADFDSGDGVAMRAPEKPDFSVLDALDLTQNFTLKAFLEHRTLSLAEHDEVFRLPRHESYQIFESLGNRHLIEAVAVPDGDGRPKSEVEESHRYRVQPLLVGAVISHLRARNIVH